MKNIEKWSLRIIKAAVVVIMANVYSVVKMTGWVWLIPVVLLAFLYLNFVPSIFNMGLKSVRLRICGNGCELLVLFLISTGISVIYSIVGFAGGLFTGSLIKEPKLWLINTLIVILTETIVFWNGIIRVYTTSAQLGIKIRVIGILCGWIPIAHLVALGLIIHTVSKEVKVENDKIILNEKRKDYQICKTKYPVLLVHGVFFRDFRYLNYWGRIPKELEKNGAVVYYGNQQSAASVKDCASELAKRIKEVLKETGADKVNIIAHSKGGLDSRYAVSMLGMAPFVASLTTINTPHRGCEFADYLLLKIPKKRQDVLAGTYNAALHKLGDHNPDFMAAVKDLTASVCRKRNETVLNVDGVYYQSVGSKLNFASNGRFPLNFSYHLVKSFDGANDGLVGECSFPWGEDYRFLTVKGKRGISHGDMIDLNRENFEGFDVREFYVQLVAELKKKGF
ncbi:MAG: triacylglycerol lipase [Lachnospiraceae bacterium]|nr:triacylglycerol lipase [Lachnospiraceae bacterium]